MDGAPTESSRAFKLNIAHRQNQTQFLWDGSGNRMGHLSVGDVEGTREIRSCDMSENG